MTLKDKLGNTATKQIVIKKDTVAPTISVGTTYKKIMLYTSYDFQTGNTVNKNDTLSGIASVKTTINGGSYSNLNQLTSTGNYTVVYTARDNAGNEASANMSLEVFYTITKYRTSYTCNCQYESYCTGYGVTGSHWQDAGCASDPVVGCTCCTGSSIPNCGVYEYSCGGYTESWGCTSWGSRPINCGTCWNSWTTTPCSGGNCQSATCRADSPVNDCNTNF